jgi:heme-binding NEAT domain protein
MTLTPFDTQTLIPWGETIVHVSSKTAGSVTTTITNAGAYQVSLSEAAKSYGVYQAGDMKFTISTDSATPKPADLITYDAKQYTVLEVTGSRWLKFHSMTARNLTLHADLRDTCNVLRPTITPSDAGLRSSSYANLFTGLACRMQPNTVEAEYDNKNTGKVNTRSKYTCYLLSNTDLVAGDLLTLTSESHAVKYQVLSTEDAESITGLQSVACEVIE